MTDKPVHDQRRHSLASIALEFLGSMNLAITLLVAVAIASVIGTVLKQNEPYNNYIIKFGPFWFEVFNKLQLYDVYHALWFLGMLAFLVLSTSICIYRNAPKMLADTLHWRENASRKSLRAFKHRDEFTATSELPEAAPKAQRVLQAFGYRVLRKEHEGHTMLAAKKGTANRWGYVATHMAIVIICIGGLLDGNIPLMIAEKMGKITIETRDVPKKDVRPDAFVDISNASFRGHVSIPEGQMANFLFLNVRDGFLVQRLPFSVEVKDFRIEHYDNGQPKSFESDLVIHDPELKEPLRQTISVNHPLSYKGVTIYQSSFSDGGSHLSLRAWPLAAPTGSPLTIDGRVNDHIDIKSSEQTLALELTDFRLFNIHDFARGEGKAQFRNVGPSFQFKLRDPDGRAREFHNYMYPVPVEGRPFILTGIRHTPAEDFRYLHIPVGADGGSKRFRQYLSLLRDEATTREIAGQLADITLSVKPDADPALRDRIIARTMELSRLFLQGGFAAIESAAVQAFAEDKREKGFEAYMNILRVQLATSYEKLLKQQGVDVSQGMSETDQRFFQDAVTAISGLPNYDSPFLMELASFEHVQATGLEMTRSPGKYVVYLGCGLLMIGVFMLFYIHQRRAWIRLEAEGDTTRILAAGMDNRKSADFSNEFSRMRDTLRRQLQATD
jgi:cytochrome c biogenesis protein